MNKRPRRAFQRWAKVGVAAAMMLVPLHAEATKVAAPMVCTLGPSDQRFRADVSGPGSVPFGETFTVRIDAVPSDSVSGFGLNHIRDMTADYLLPEGATYVAGSARVVPNTGTPNVRVGAKVTVEHRALRLTLPAQVKEGDRYTPPSIEVTMRADAPVGTTLTLSFVRFGLTANALIVGDLEVLCTPKPQPFTLLRTTVVSL